MTTANTLPWHERSRRIWQLKMLGLAAEELLEPERDGITPSWDQLVRLALQFGGRAEPKPTRAEFDALRFMTIGQMFLPNGDIAAYHEDEHTHHGDNVHTHRFQGQSLRHEHAGGAIAHRYFGHPEDVPPIGEPEHPTCGRCGVRRDVHDDKTQGHPWQWNRPRFDYRAKAVDWLRRDGPASDAEVAGALKVTAEYVRPHLGSAVADRQLWVDESKTPRLFYAVSHATPGCDGCGRPLVFVKGAAGQYHDEGCPEREALERSVWT